MIKIEETKREKMIESVKAYFLENEEMEIGDLKAGFFLDFCLREIAPTVYNLAIAEATAYMIGKTEDLESDCYHPEFTFWKK